MIRLTISSRATPVGTIVFAARGAALCALGFAEQWPSLRARLERRFDGAFLEEREGPPELVGAIDAYLAGDAGALERVEVDPGGTPFQQRVWSALRAIPAGATTSYAAIAESIGAPRAVRAVGAANGRNPVSLAIPCHRVIASGGGLCGYAGGLERKRWLLSHERARAAASLS